MFKKPNLLELLEPPLGPVLLPPMEVLRGLGGVAEEGGVGLRGGFYFLAGRFLLFWALWFLEVVFGGAGVDGWGWWVVCFVADLREKNSDRLAGLIRDLIDSGLTVYRNSSLLTLSLALPWR